MKTDDPNVVSAKLNPRMKNHINETRCRKKEKKNCLFTYVLQIAYESVQ